MSFIGILGEGIAALDHEAFDDAMKRSAVVEAFLGQFGKVFHGLGGDIVPEFDDQIAVVG